MKKCAHPDLQGETALVTGGSRNIGLAIAKALRDAGAKICILARSDEHSLSDAIDQLGGEREVMGGLVDVSDEPRLMKWFDRIVERMGPPSILVNGAAYRPHAPLTEITRKAWSEVIDTILTGAFFTSRELFRRLPAERNGAIVNIGGLSAHRPIRERAHVIAAKAGLIGLTRALAEEGAGRIRANAVVPGRIDTKRRPNQSNPNTALAEEGDRWMGTSEDVARVVLSLSDPKDVYVTGQTIHVSGGRFMP